MACLVRELLKPAFANLLLPTALVQIGDKVWSGGFKIRGRIVECQVSVFTGTDESHVDLMLY